MQGMTVADFVQYPYGKTGNSHYIGCIGKDAFGETMKTQLEADGVAGHFMEVEDKPTGTCAVLVKDNERSLIANLASDAVDPGSYLTKRLLRQCGAEYRLLPCLASSGKGKRG